MKRKRGRPKKFRGEKDRKNFAEQMLQVLPPLVEFIERWKLSVSHSGPRYQRKPTLEYVAKKHGLSQRSLERLYTDPFLRSLAEQIARSHIDGQHRVPLEIEYLPLPPASVKRKRGRPRK